MFDQPAKGDVDRVLSALLHEARSRIAERRNEIAAEFTKAGGSQSTRRILTTAKAADAIHAEITQRAVSTLLSFVQRMNSPLQVAEWAKPHLENIGNVLLGGIPPCGFPIEQQRIVGQYKAQFDQRLDGALRDVAIGFVNGEGFAGSLKQSEWVRAADAIEMLEPFFSGNSARLRICERAHAGMIRTRAEEFHHEQRVFRDHDIPKDFWWAEGHQALEQDWVAGDFSTWIKRNSVQLKAFGVTFVRADIQKLVPAGKAQVEKTVAHTDEDASIIEVLEELIPSAALSYKQAISDLNDGNRVSFRGPALELREALREALDHLAPDAQVMASKDYVQEKEKAGPTMKQKARFIMKKKGKRSSSDAPEQAIAAFEESIAGLTRAVYERSSKAVHVAGERQAVMQLRRYVVAVFHDILEA